MKQTVNFRTSKLSQETKEYIEQQEKRGKTTTQIIIALMEKGLEQKHKENSLLQTRGESIDTHQAVFRKKPILIPCPNTMRWVDPKADCKQGCRLKCKLTANMKKLIEALLLFSEPIDAP